MFSRFLPHGCCLKPLCQPRNLNTRCSCLQQELASCCARCICCLFAKRLLITASSSSRDSNRYLRQAKPGPDSLDYRFVCGPYAKT
jgi:hypothetical protein